MNCTCFHFLCVLPAKWPYAPELYNKMWIWFDLICKWQIDIHVCQQYAYNMLFLHNACNVRACAKGNRLLQMEKKIVISKLARLDAPDSWAMSVCSRGCNVMRIKEIEQQPKNRNRRWCYRPFIECVYKSSFINCSVCQLVFLLSSVFFFVLLNFLIFYSLIIRICWVRAVFSSSSYFSSAFYFFSSRVFRWTLRIFQLREKAHNFSFILSSHSAVVIVVAAATFLSSHSVALAHSTFDSLTYRHPSHVSHFVITLVEFIVNYCCLNIYLFFYLSGIFRLEQHS